MGWGWNDLRLATFFTVMWPVLGLDLIYEPDLEAKDQPGRGVLRLLKRP